jgi:hypothetical protein
MRKHKDYWRDRCAEAEAERDYWMNRAASDELELREYGITGRPKVDICRDTKTWGKGDIVKHRVSGERFIVLDLNNGKVKARASDYEILDFHAYELEPA